MADPLHPAAVVSGSRDDDDLSATCHEPGPMKCCCGSVECVFLRHNCSVLASVEKDVHTAARMGQALLARHEAYMADAERDRTELTARIEQLEVDNKELEIRNARTIEENRNLLDQLETLNTTVVDSEGRITSLEATLLSSQQAVRRLEGETARAAALERQLAALEQEQAELQSCLSMSREEARSAVSRWKRAERGINDLQEQLERMEKEAKEEREYHVEVMGRIERQREMEKELNTAAGRLKGAAAAKSMDRGPGIGSNAVSHFVRDLLQDNANLQYGIAELREMLMNSNDEIQALQNQLMYHQPLGDDQNNATSTLSAELKSDKNSPGEKKTPKTPKELHIHHHYHLPKSKQEAKKPRKKRQSLTPGIFTPPGSFVPSTPPSGLIRHQFGSHAHRDSLLSNYWSASDFTPSSVPSSPWSNRRNSLFDHPIESFPCSPTTSIDPTSPTWHASHQKQFSNISSRSFQLPANPVFIQPAVTHSHAIIEESDDEDNPPDLTSATDESIADEAASLRDGDTVTEELSLNDDADSRQMPLVRLRRPLSHESVISLTGGLDIHTLKSRPSQLTIGQIGSASSVTGSSIVIARPMLSRDNAKRSSVVLRESYGTSPVESMNSTSDSSMRGLGPSKIGRWVGWRPWGGGGGNSSASTASSRIIKERNSQQSLGRPPGINQPGAIPGFSEYVAAAQRRTPPAKIQPDNVDRDALREGLDEGALSIQSSGFPSALT
ncbi:uncharacterized protein GGS22DRAFT_174339 [Annulohypoxylon maeteangense]|uniref:uncharacterized protein n=1 Tax=Annulohypoxylon maeteangense TaxID=1927788 RepID=UPI00200868F0|nr:uncharacterized protein GGS22DRAFT_174339 [Annulohypoxylon maeteangense]KAI0880610.1 hypothetical protein GGS22DRAFT_174339 [Annulohypoxylon maeteangense]